MTTRRHEDARRALYALVVTFVPSSRPAAAHRRMVARARYNGRDEPGRAQGARAAHRCAASSSRSATRAPRTPTPAAARSPSCSTAAGHHVVGRTIVKDDPELVRGTIERQLADARRAGDHHDRRHRHHVARQHVRSGQRPAAEAARRLRRAVPDAQLPGDRLGRDDEPRLRRPRPPAASSSRCPDRKRPCAWRWKSSIDARARHMVAAGVK